jgi:endonuclease-3
MTRPPVRTGGRPKSAAGLVRKVRRLSRILDRIYGPRTWQPGDDVLDQLIKTILSQNTSDTNSLRAFHSLRERFPTWDDVHRASPGQVTAAIRSGGLARIKAGRIKTILDQICREQSGCDLSFLRRWSTDRVREYLAGFTGVGEKTIACVLLFALGRPVMPVDTHVQRVGQRLGLIPPRANAAQAHALLQDIVPADLVYALHLHLIEHGRAVCKARKPRCGNCSLRVPCTAYRQRWPQIL